MLPGRHRLFIFPGDLDIQPATVFAPPTLFADLFVNPAGRIALLNPGRKRLRSQRLHEAHTLRFFAAQQMVNQFT